MLSTEDRSAFGRHCTSPATSTPPTRKTGPHRKDLFHKPYDPNHDVRKSSIKSLLSWAHHRYLSAIAECRGQDRDFQAMYWDGYKKAIEEILEMENQ